MFGKYLPILPALALLAACTTAPRQLALQGPDHFTAACSDWDEWDKPAPPFRIHGSTYYVGTCGIASILITGESGHVLIDSGTGAGADIVLANIATLGFDPQDVNILLYSHEHFDHVGGMAKLQRATGAVLIASDEAEPVLRTGIASADDPQSGMHEPMEPVPNVQGGGTLGEDSHPVYLGNLELYPIATPGHTPGALSWRWESCEASGCIDIVYADSLSPISRDDYRFADNPDYVRRYRKGLAQLSTIECDLLLTPHPSASEMFAKLKGDTPLLDPSSCATYAAAIATRLDERLAKEADRGDAR